MFPVIHYDNLYVHTYLYKCVVKLLKGGETQEEKRLLCLKIVVKLSIFSKIDTILRFVSCLFAEDKM